MKLSTDRIFLVVTMALIASITNILHVFLAALKTPPGVKYLWAGHYFADYFTYLQAIVQGMRGRWLVNNPFATDDPSILFQWWPYILMGKVASLLHISAIAVYWSAVVIFSVVFSLLAFYVIRLLLAKQSFFMQLAAFLFFLVASPFFKVGEFLSSRQIAPYDFFYAPNVLFKRFGNVPYHILGSILLLATLIAAARFLSRLSDRSSGHVIKDALLLSALLIIVLTFSPFSTLAVLVTIVVMSIASMLLQGNRKGPVRQAPHLRLRQAVALYYSLFLAIVIFIVGAAAVGLKLLYGTAPILQRASQWEVSQMFFPSLLQFVQIMGPLVILAPFGFVPLARSKSMMGKVFASYLVVSLVFFISPVAGYLGSHNWRFLSPLHYIVLAAMAILGIQEIARIIRAGRRFTVGTIVVLLFFFLPVTITVLNNQIADPNLATDVSFVRREMLEAFEVLDDDPDTRAVLTGHHLGLLVPIFADRRVYVAREISTPDFHKKREIADKFLRGQMEEGSGEKFLSGAGVGFVFLTHLDNYDIDKLKTYDFLTEVFANESAVILKVLDEE